MSICSWVPEVYCSDDFSWVAIITPIIIGAAMTKVISVLEGYRRNKQQNKLKGKWYRYGIGFYLINETDGYPFHAADVEIKSRFRVISKNKTYSYKGKLELGKSEVIYIYWTGKEHEEKMLSVYTEPLVVNESTVLIGVKSCISKNRKPAANAEILSKRPLSKEEAESYLLKYNNILVQESDKTLADYEVSNEAV